MIDAIFDWLDDHGWKLVAGFIALVIIGIIVVPTWITIAYYHGDDANKIHEACMIEDKESINKSDSHEYRVYTDCGNFVVEDEFWAGNFHASETYADLTEGRAYDLRTRGWRVPFMSWFPNIYEATPTGETAK